MARRSSKQQTAQTTSIPAPVKGLNAKDSIASMPPDFALILDNYYCWPDSVESRAGSNSWVTGITGNVETICHYSNVSGTNKLFAAAGANVYDVTLTGAVGAAVVSGQTSARYQWTNFATPTPNQYLYMVNGADKPLLYDGSAWVKVDGVSVPAITGVTTSNLIHVNVFGQRLWFIEKNTTKAWYLPVNSIGGAAVAFDLASILQKGGYLMAMATWTIDNTNGINDYAVFISSEGEVVIYEGYDPSSATTFVKVGQFMLGRPVGRRCFTKLGSDNVLISADGVGVLSKQLTTDRNVSAMLSYNITNMINLDIQSYGANFGWEPVYFPSGNKLLINVPTTEGSASYQYVMNTITGAWSTWNKYNSGYTAFCWDVFNDEMYFGGNGVVYKGDIGESDDGAGIYAIMQPAFSYFGELGRSKLFTLVRPITASAGTLYASLALNLDYNQAYLASPPWSSTSASEWDTSPWDLTPWGGGVQVLKDWISLGGVGYSASLSVATLTKGMKCKVLSIDYVYELGGVL